MRKPSHLLLGSFLVILLSLAWGIYYVQDKGFSRHWRHFVQSEFRKRGVHATIRRLNLDPIRGLIAKDVQLFEDPDHLKLLMDIDKVAIDVDYSELLSGQLSIRSVEVRDAKMAIPLAPGLGDGEPLLVDQFNGRILTPPDQFRIVRASAIVNGVHVSIHGALSRSPPNPSPRDEDAASPSPPAAAPFDHTQFQLSRLRSHREQIRRILTWVDRLEMDPASPPRMDVAIKGELDRLTDLHASGTLESGPLRYRGYRADSVSAAFVLSDRSLNVNSLTLKDTYGRLRAEFQFLGAGRDLRFALSSNNDFHGLAVALFDAPPLKEFVFFDPPAIEVSGVYHLEKPFSWSDLPIQAIGEIRAQGLTSRGVVFGAMGFDFNIDADRLFLRNVRLEHKSGVLSGSFLRDSGGIRYETDFRLPPTVFSPFIEMEGAKQFLKRWTFTGDSAVLARLEGSGPTLNPADWVTTGVIDLRNCALNGHPISELQCELRLQGTDHEFFDVKLLRPEGEIRGGRIHLDHQAHLCHLESVSGKVFPVHAVGWFAPKAAQHLVVYEFDKPPHIEIDGVIDTRPESLEKQSHSRSSYSLSFSSDDHARYVFLGRRFDLLKPKGTVQIDGTHVLLNDFSAGLLDGSVKARVDLSNIHSTIDYSIDAQLYQVNFSSLLALFDQPRQTDGLLNAGAKIVGRGPGLDQLRAEGRAVIQGADVFSIPSISPLAKPISKALPRLHSGIHNATEAAFSFTIQDGVFTTPDFAASTTAYDLTGHGDIDLRSSTLDFLININLRHAPLIASLLSFKGEGSLGEPVWRPSDLVRIQGEPVRKITSGAVSTLRKVGQTLQIPLPLPPQAGDDPPVTPPAPRRRPSPEDERPPASNAGPRR